MLKVKHGCTTISIYSDCLSLMLLFTFEPSKQAVHINYTVFSTYVSYSLHEFDTTMINTDQSRCHGEDMLRYAIFMNKTGQTS